MLIRGKLQCTCSKGGLKWQNDDIFSISAIKCALDQDTLHDHVLNNLKVQVCCRGYTKGIQLHVDATVQMHCDLATWSLAVMRHLRMHSQVQLPRRLTFVYLYFFISWMSSYLSFLPSFGNSFKHLSLETSLSVVKVLYTLIGHVGECSSGLTSACSDWLDCITWLLFPGISDGVVSLYRCRESPNMTNICTSSWRTRTPATRTSMTSARPLTARKRSVTFRVICPWIHLIKYLNWLKTK